MNAPTVKTDFQSPLSNRNAGSGIGLSIHPLERVMIGEDFDFYVTFNSLSMVTGYGPFVDLIFPSNGADGAAGTDTPDGLNFIIAKYEGYTLPSTSLVFPDDDQAAGPGTTGCVAHPLAMDDTGNAIRVCGTAGDTLVVLELPFSSITPDLPTLTLVVTAHVSNLADLDTPLTILGRGGYRFGTDSLNNPISDPPVLNPSSQNGSGWPSLQVTPRLIAIEKSFDGPQECPYNLPPVGPILNEADCPYGSVNPVYESVSGPNFQRHYDLNIYVAAGQTVTGLAVTDYFPNNLAFLSVDSLGGGTLVDSPTVGVAANPPDNNLVVNFIALTGSTDIVVSFFIPELDAGGNPVLDPATGVSSVAENTATALGDWTPIDLRDPGGPGNAIANGPTCPGDCTPLHTLNLRSIAVQKSVEIADDTGAPGYSPGDILQYTLEFQISDYFTFGDLVVTDVLSDGQRFDNPGGLFPPTFSVSDRYTTLTDHDFTYTPPPGAPAPTDDLIVDESQIANTGVPGDGTDGSTTLTFEISKAMLNADAVDGILQGGEAGDDPPGSGTPVTGAVPAIGTITFYAVVQEDFSDTYPSGDSSVDHGDALFNSVTIAGSLRDEVNNSTTLGTQTNDSVQKIKIVYGSFQQNIFAVNGSTTFAAEVQPLDTITFRLRQGLPSSDSDSLVLFDFLPLPLFDAAEVTTFDNVLDAAVPLAGHAKYGPNNTLAILPAIAFDAPENRLAFQFGSFDDPLDATTEIDILFTVTVSNAPYQNGAVLTNLTLAEEGTTNNGVLIRGSGVRFTTRMPAISLRKGVVASSNAAAIFNPTPPGPVAFNPPGSNPSWNNLIASGDNDPNTSLINSDIENVNSGDLVTYAIVLENLGHSSLGAFDIGFRDMIPANLGIPAGGINLQARRGDGAVMAFTPIAGTATEPSGLFDDGIRLADEGPAQGATHVYSPSNGQNLIVITYDLQVAPGLDFGTQMVNTATLVGFAGTEAGPNYVGATPTANINSDNATTTTNNPFPVVVFGNLTSPTDGEVLTAGPTLLVVEFNKQLQTGGSMIPGAADNLENYLLVGEGPVGGFQTASCAAGADGNDSIIAIQSAVYSDNIGSGPFFVTLALTTPLPAGRYRLFICGTTSIEDTFGQELNDGNADTTISFVVAPLGESTIPTTGFAPRRATVLPPQTKPYADFSLGSEDGLGDLWLEIPALGVQTPIVGVPQTDGSWDVSWLGDDAGWLNGSAFPTWEGNSVLTGHVYDAYGKPGPFIGLNTLGWGDQIIIHAWGGQYVYEVRAALQVSPTDTAAMMKHQERPWLTLVTCRGYDPNSDSYKYRVLVRAVLVKVK